MSDFLPVSLYHWSQFYCCIALNYYNLELFGSTVVICRLGVTRWMCTHTHTGQIQFEYIYDDKLTNGRIPTMISLWVCVCEFEFLNSYTGRTTAKAAPSHRWCENRRAETMIIIIGDEKNNEKEIPNFVANNPCNWLEFIVIFIVHNLTIRRMFSLLLLLLCYAMQSYEAEHARFVSCARAIRRTTPNMLIKQQKKNIYFMHLFAFPFRK